MLLNDDPARAFMPYPAVAVPGATDGPLAGLTFAAKDLFDVAGYPTGGGSPHVLAMSGIKARTAPAVQRLLDAGARFVGKTHTDELAFSLNGKNAHFGTPVNGAAPDRVPGGSSSGSASAVSNGLCDTALGTDTGGSVRGPASHCGLFGLRPTHGRISLDGCLDLAPSFDTCGFFARDGETFARVAAVMLGDDPTPLPGTPRLLLAADAFAMLDTEVRGALAPLIQQIEHSLGTATLVETASAGFEPLYWAFRRLQGREAWRVDGPMIERFRPPLGPGVAERFAYARALPEDEVADAETCRAQFRERMMRLLGADGILLLPTMPDCAPLLAADETSLEGYRNKALNLLCLSGLSGVPGEPAARAAPRCAPRLVAHRPRRFRPVAGRAGGRPRRCRGERMTTSEVVPADRFRIAVPCRCSLGEGPVWDGRIGVLHWVDIVAGTLFSWCPERAGPPDTRDLGEPAGFVALTPDPRRVLVGLASGIARLDLATGRRVQVLAPEPGQPGNRLNDGNAAEDGSLWFGSMDRAERDATGAFYRWSAEGLRAFGGAATVTNGPVVDSRRRIAYAADTTRGRVFRHRLDANGEPGPAEPFVAFAAGEGHPDGLTLDAQGYVWICHFGGARISRYTPAGKVALVLEAPTAQVTKVAFGGPALETLYVTTAARGRDPEVERAAGHLLAIEVGIAGRPAGRCTLDG